MKREIQSLLVSLSSGKINRDEFLKLYFGNESPNEKYCLKLLQQGIIEKDSDAIEEAIIVIFAAGFNLNAFANILCELLVAEWHFKHEDIAIMLKELRDPTTVVCLSKAVKIQFNYLNYDNSYQFSRKCIKALAAIGNENAISELKKMAKNENNVIAGYAEKELRYKGIM